MLGIPCIVYTRHGLCLVSACVTALYPNQAMTESAKSTGQEKSLAISPAPHPPHVCLHVQSFGATVLTTEAMSQ